jgi:hypothetical protein
MKVGSAKTMFLKMCTPAQVYLVIAFLSCLLYLYHMVSANDQLVQMGGQSVHGFTIVGIAMKVGFAVLWTLVLNYICKRFKHGTTIAWVILLLPIFFFAFAAVMGLFVISQMVSGSRTSQQTHAKLKTHVDRKLSTMTQPAVVQEEPIQDSKVAGYSWQGLQQGHPAVPSP